MKNGYIIPAAKFSTVVLILLALLAADYSLAKGGADYVPVSIYHPVYSFLDWMETKGIIDWHGSCKPLSRQEIGGCLKTVYQSENSLTAREKSELKRFLREFADSSRPAGFTDISRLRERIWSNSVFYRDGYNLYSLEKGDISAMVNPVLYWDFTVDSTGDMITRRTNGINIFGGFGDDLGVNFDFRDNLEIGRGPYSGREKLYSDHVGYAAFKWDYYCYYDFTRASIAGGKGKFHLNFGRNDNEWGPGTNGNLMISGNPPPYDCLVLRYEEPKALRFVYMTGFLHPYPEILESADTTAEGRIRKIYASKYIASHRIEIYPWSWLETGFSEGVVYGERGLEPAYLNPFNLYYSAQHNLSDMDNVVMCADVKAGPFFKTIFYGEFFLDDISTKFLGTDYIGNKFAYLAGFHCVEPGKVRNIMVSGEYARIDPFVYSHFYDINKYKNWNSGLGYFLEPNSERWGLRMDWKPLYEFEGGISGEYILHGENTDSINAGGNIDTPPDSGQFYAPFLGGNLIKEKVFQIYAKYQPLENYFILGRLRYKDYTGGNAWEWQLTTGVDFR